MADGTAAFSPVRLTFSGITRLSSSRILDQMTRDW